MRGSRGESESCEDLEGSRNHALIERGVRRRRGPETPPRKSIFFRLHSKITEYMHRTPFPRPWKTFLDLCMEAISFCKKVSHLRMLIHIYFRGFFPGCTGKIRKVGIYMYTFNSFEKTICSSVNNMIYKCLLLLYPSDLLV